ncbi:mevalonate kinase [Streptobacillus moniliformis]|uniref:mevalonate kinase n=1 Tax=Streptobacillus moniliformis TaxID=34105 RepID=UPI0007E37CC3|nr:mevalonate kinase [Streptobacillus moniliformis]
MAYGKVILFGEHSVVYGKNAIALLLKSVKIEADIVYEYVFENEHVKFIKKNIIEKSNIKDRVYIKIKSTIPSSRGLGSSAALAVSIAMAFKKRYNISDEIVKTIVFEAEKWAHGNPSGIDLAVIFNNQNVLFNKKEGIENIDFHLNAKLVISDSGIRGNTKKAVSMVAKNYNKFEKYIEDLGKITDDAIIALKNSDLKMVGNLMNLAQNNLKLMNLSNDMIDELINVSKENSLGSKITGAGLGGCIISLVENEKKALELKKLLIKKGAKKVWLEDI